MAGVLGTAALVVYLALFLQVTTDAAQLLPAPDDKRLALIGRALAESELTRSQILSIGGADLPQALTAAQQLATALAADREVAQVQVGPDPQLATQLWQLYGPRRFGLANDLAQEATGLTDALLRGRARELKRQLSLPTAPLIKGEAPGDPLLVLPYFVRNLEQLGAGGLRIDGGQFVSADGQRAIVLLSTRHSALAADLQAPLLETIAREFKRINSQAGGSLTLQHAAIARFSTQARASIEADVQRIASVSLVAITVLFFGLFRSLRLLLLAQLPIVLALLAATAATQLVFGRVHGLTLAFGSTLIGVCIDYPIHYLNHHTLAPHADGPRAGLKMLWTGLWLGAATTVAGFVGLGWSAYPGIREVAVYATVGIFTALYSTSWFLPLLVPAVPKPVALQQALAAALERTLTALRQRKQWLIGLLAAAVVVAMAGLPVLHWNDDISVLSSIDPVLQAEDAAVRAQLAPDEPGQLLVTTAPDLETALQRNDDLAKIVSGLQKKGVVDGFRSLSALLPSAKSQRESLANLQRDPTLPARLEAAFVAEGFRAGAFAPFAGALQQALPPLTWPQLQASALGNLARVFVGNIDGQPAVFTFLRQVHQPHKLSSAVASVPGVTFFDQKTFANQAWAAYRTTTWTLVLFGIVAILLLVYARYRTLGQTAIAAVPAIVAGFATLGLLCLCGEALNLLHLIGFVLVLSIGVDYGVYLAEITPHPASEPATLLSIVVAALSAVLGFGLLGLSSNPALRAIGLTTGIGVLFSLVLAPTLLVLATATRRRDNP